MKLRSILAGTALAALTLSAAPQLGGPALTRPAEAAVEVNISIFYDQLGQYGDWVTYDDEFVFIPGRVDADWRPYTEGHWVYTKRYGWTWASDEPFGWAAYHYGRWGYSDEIGWYWVPGRKWAPAWVSWRRSNDYVVWAPLPPSRRGGDIDVSINISVGDIPDYYWVAVPTRRFLAPDIAVVVVNDDRDIREVVERTEYIGTPRITNNIVVNSVIDVDVIAQETGQTVEAVEVKTTANPAEAKATADQVTAFQGEIAADTQAKPRKLTEVDKVRKVKRNKPTENDNATTTPDASTTDAVTAPVDGSNGGAATSAEPSTTEAPAPATGKSKKRIGTAAPADEPGDQSAAPVTGDSPAPQDQDQPTGKKKKRQQNQNASAPVGSEQPAAEAQDQPAGKKKRQQKDQNASAPDGGEQPQVSKKKRKPQAGDEATGSTTPAPSQADDGNAPDAAAEAPAVQKKKGKAKKDQACEPGDPDCAAQ